MTDEKLVELFSGLENRMDQGFARIDQRFDGLEKRVGAIEVRLDKVEYRLDRVEHRLDKLEDDVASLKSDVTTLKSDVAGVKDDVSWLKTQVGENTKMIRAIRDAEDTNRAEIAGLKLSKASTESVKEIKDVLVESEKAVHKVFSEKVYHQQIA